MSRPRTLRRRNQLAFWSKVFVFVGGLGLLAMYVVDLAGPFDALIPAIERSIHEFLDGRLGRSDAWDWTMVGAASHSFSAWAMLLLTGSSIAEAWLKRRRHYGQSFGYLAFAAAVSLLASELGDEISDELRRPAPWHEFGKAKILGAEALDFFRQGSHAGIPDEDVLGMACAMCLLTIRLGKTSVLAFALLSIRILGQLSLGNQWFATELLSVLAGTLLAGTLLFLARGGVLWVERKSEVAYVALFWKSLIRPEERRAWRAAEDARAIKRELARARARRGRRKHRFWYRMIESELLPILEPGAHEHEVAERPAGEAGKRVRPSRYVRFLIIPGGRTYVVKAVRRLGGIFHSPDRLYSYERSAKCSLHLERLGLPVPRTFWARSGILYFGTVSFFVSAEEYIEGRPLDCGGSSEILKAAGLLARVHRNRSATWGEVSRTASGLPHQFAMHRLRPAMMHYLGRVAEHVREPLSEAEIEAVWALFEREALAVLVRTPEPFALVHGDVTARNFILAGDGELRLIDFVTVSYDLAGCEIVKTVYSLGRGPSHLGHEVWCRYFSEAGAEAWQRFLGEARLCLAMHALREAAHRRAFFTKSGKTPPPSPAEAIAWIKGLFGEQAAIWGATPEETDWQAVESVLRPTKQRAPGSAREPADGE